ncbi:MAG TPA: 3D domain-containing protein [Vicinamibacterales bacterium]|nr:3D domain-containing protein [Vicinamibacterales bacterium]
MFLSRSLRRKLVVTAGAVAGFVFLYEATVFDSRSAARQASLREERAVPAPGARLRFTATAYCKGQTTASGVGVRSGIAAADPALLPVGSVIRVEQLGQRYDGVYTVMDTGPRVKGRQIDLYMWSCYEALDFGRRPVVLTVLRLGWNPRASSPGVIQRLFRQREAAAGTR